MENYAADSSHQPLNVANIQSQKYGPTRWHRYHDGGKACVCCCLGSTVMHGGLNSMSHEHAVTTADLGYYFTLWQPTWIPICWLKQKPTLGFHTVSSEKQDSWQNSTAYFLPVKNFFFFFWYIRDLSLSNYLRFGNRRSVVALVIFTFWLLLKIRLYQQTTVSNIPLTGNFKATTLHCIKSQTQGPLTVRRGVLSYLKCSLGLHCNYNHWSCPDTGCWYEFISWINLRESTGTDLGREYMPLLFSYLVVKSPRCGTT